MSHAKRLRCEERQFPLCVPERADNRIILIPFPAAVRIKWGLATRNLRQSTRIMSLRREFALVGPIGRCPLSVFLGIDGADPV